VNSPVARGTTTSVCISEQSSPTGDLSGKTVGAEDLTSTLKNISGVSPFVLTVVQLCCDKRALHAFLEHNFQLSFVQNQSSSHAGKQLCNANQSSVRAHNQETCFKSSFSI